MNINIQYVELPFSERITEYIVQALNALKKSYPWISGADVSLKRIKELNEVKESCEIELKIPGFSLFVSSMENKCDIAARETTLKLNKILRNRKSVLRAR